MKERERSNGPLQAIGSARRRWHFGRSILDERTHELLVDGVDAEVERKPLEVLIYLLQHAGEVCTKDELLESVWPGRVLSETVLNKSIGRLRDVLRDDNQEIIKTAHGFGYRFIASVRVETAEAPEPAGFDLQPGLHPPARPLWSLVERLGAGGHGEAWRARHDKTKEERVFKFALEETALVALKREITLFRVINDALAESARVVKLLDWNLEQLPYFVETEYIAGGNLLEWVNLRGGAAAIPLANRLEIVAKVAEALGAVHSVGVLHKDLKPSNVLVRPGAGDTPDIVLGDFGSGSMLDATRLDRLGITRLGFTKTLASNDSGSGTPMYLAPEVLAGQPFTVKSDMYALGIMLYQFVSGDFHKVMSSGWERGIDDELLREDIGLMAEGNPGERLGDAEALARRLRTLPERRLHLAAEREARAKAERARRLLERAQARRFGLALAFGALISGLIVSTTLYFKARRAQELAVIAANQSQSVKDFLGKDVFAPVSSGAEPVRDMTVVQLLTRAGDEIDTRFASQPDVAAELHYVIGRSFQSFLDSSQAVKHFRQSLDLGEHLSGQGSRAAMRSASELIAVDFFVGLLGTSIGRYNDILAAGRKLAGETAPEVLDLRLNLARGYYLLGEWNSANRMFQDLLADVGAIKGDRSELVGRAEFYYGQLLTDLSEPTEAQRYLRLALDQLSRSLGERHVMVIEAHTALGRALSDGGQFPQAAGELDRAHGLALKWAPLPSWIETRPRFFTALMLLREDRPAEAEPLLAEIVNFENANEAAYLETHKGMTPELDHTGPVRQALGEAYAREGRLPEALETLQRAVTVSERASGAKHPSVISVKLSLVETLIDDRRIDEARHVAATIADGELSALPAAHPILAHWYRAKGLLEARENEVIQARVELVHALDVFRTAYGPGDWHVARVRQDLQLISSERPQP